MVTPCKVSCTSSRKVAGAADVPAAVWANAKVEVKTTTDRRLGIPRFMILSNLRELQHRHRRRGALFQRPRCTRNTASGYEALFENDMSSYNTATRLPGPKRPGN